MVCWAQQKGADMDHPPLTRSWFKIRDTDSVRDSTVADLLAEAARRARVEPVTPSPAVLAQLMARVWPGNVRELRNAAERVVLGLGLEDAQSDDAEASVETGRLAERVAAFEREQIVQSLRAHGGALRPVYESLGLSRKTLYEKMQKLGIDKAHYS